MRHDAFTAALGNPLELHAMIEKGLPVSLLDQVASSLGLKVEAMAALCGVSRATFHRKKADRARLGHFESDMLARYAALLNRAAEVFEDRGTAGEWLRTPQVGLGGAKPMDLAQTTQGYREVEKLLTRIDHGVYA
ncbi:antitoxin Xre/MbcA/ParS toxin-binding domain-containing protein [Opitutus sp. ER46]|uniref:type II RES/Xre toxin-antitoxin system antitoxin n=1 Tax=Opitutus sp. ER46 TaxID=2161864 RepID=UPI001304C386|nr:antitoxin Xre/MbcA/ParS toxin-binding domain-containing protein [Opitutus sp. ER46]